MDGLSDAELKGLIKHEVMHNACGHPWRKGARNHKKFNVAADYAINPIILDSGDKLPQGALIAPQFKGKSAEWIYDRLPDNQDDDGAGFGFEQALNTVKEEVKKYVDTKEDNGVNKADKCRKRKATKRARRKVGKQCSKRKS